MYSYNPSQLHLLFFNGLHSVKVWADTTEEAARATAAVVITFENILYDALNV